MTNDLMYKSTNRDGQVTLSILDAATGYNKVVPRDHVNFTEILLALHEVPQDREKIEGLVDPTLGIGREMSEITDRITWDMHHLYLDGLRFEDVGQGKIAKVIHEKIQSGEEWKRLVRFALNLSDNPSHRAQEAVWEWVQRHGVSITEDGRLMGYKGLTHDHLSVWSGPNNFINGVLYGEPGKPVQVPHEVGSVISKRRADVDDGPAACSTGLHVGAYNYASTFMDVHGSTRGTDWEGAGTFALLAFNPRDVVNAGSGGLDVKIRVCEYEVMEFLEKPAPVLEEQVAYQAPEKTQETVQKPGEGTQEVEVGGKIVTLRVPVKDKPQLSDWAAFNKPLLDDLSNKTLGHKPLARKWIAITTEASVRRYRKANNINLNLRTRVGL